MLTKKRKFKEIKEKLSNDESILIIGCHGCAKDSGTGGPEEVKEALGIQWMIDYSFSFICIQIWNGA